MTLSVIRRRMIRFLLGAGPLLVLLAAVVGYTAFDNATSAPIADNPAGRQTSLMPSQWQYLPGSHPQTDGLLVSSSDFKIVEQDGSGGQANPPVNLYGAHARVAGDFTVDAIMKNPRGRSAFQLYGSTPIIQDEFRVEPASIRLEVSGDKLTVSVWDGTTSSNLTASKPYFQKQYAVDVAQSLGLRVSRQAKQLIVSANGKQVARLDDPGIFKPGNVWFGADNSGGGYLLSDVRAGALNGGHVQIIDTTKEAKATISGEPLQAAASAKRPGFKIGAAVALAPLVSDAQYRSLALGGNFGSLTTENALKWQFVEPAEGAYDFQEADAIVNQAARNDIAIHGHTLVFGEANPAWVQKLPIKTIADKQHVQKVMTDHITALVNHYKGRIASWDVVNEPLADYDNFDASNGQILRDHVWLRAQGEQYIGTSFRTARAADPTAKLYMNEYGLEADGERWNAFLALVARLKQQNVPIDGVGFESHIYSADDKIDTSVLRKHIQQLASLGLTSRISEIDVYSDDGTQAQAARYASVLQTCLAQPSCVSWTTWGISDRYDLYQDDDEQLQHGQDLLWDTHTRPTPALGALFKVLR